MIEGTESPIPVVRLRACHAGDLEVVIETQPEEIKGRAGLFTLLIGKRLRIPHTILVRLQENVVGFAAPSSIQSKQLMRDLFSTAIDSLEKKCQTAIGSEGRALAIALRDNKYETTQWHPTQLNVGSTIEASTPKRRRAKIVEEILRRICTVNENNENNDHCYRDGCLFEVLLQQMCPTMMEEGDVVGTLWTRNPYTGEQGSIGYVRVRDNENSVSFMSFSEWTGQAQEKADELCEWLRRVGEIEPEVLCISFGVSSGTLYLLDLNIADTTHDARIRVLADQLESFSIAQPEQLVFLKPEDIQLGQQVDDCQRRRLSRIASHDTKGTSVKCGRVVLSASCLKRVVANAEPAILVKESLAPTDVALFGELVGVVASSSGPASHLVVMARGCGLAVISGLHDLEIDLKTGMIDFGTVKIKEGDWVTIDERSGILYAGKLDICQEVPRWVSKIIELTKHTSQDRIFVNADTASDAQRGFMLGAGGVGLCRSENHVLLSENLPIFRRWMVGNIKHRSDPLPAEVKQTLRQGLESILFTADGRRVHYRLFDAHIEDILPHPGTEDAYDLASTMGIPIDEFDNFLHEMRTEGGPHGWRGCRWGIDTGFYRQQLRIVADAVRTVVKNGKSVRIAIIAPMISVLPEINAVFEYFRMELKSGFESEIAASVIELEFGCMIETPRACIIIEDIARSVDVICIGSNDLTEGIWALGRESGGRVLGQWIARGTVDFNPFVTLDRVGVGELIRNAIVKAKLAQPSLKIVACGEQASDPESAVWLSERGVDSISCHAEAVPAVAIAIAQCEIARHNNTYIDTSYLQPSGIARTSRRIYRRIHYAQSCGAKDVAQKLALELGSLFCIRLSLPETTNWKFLKRDIIQFWFGSREFKRFPPVWSSKDVLEYAMRFRDSGRTVRYSLFPNTIACHATSEVLRNCDDIEKWRHKIDSLNHQIAVEVFPQQSESHVCFRAVFWGSYVDIEAGIGQAMYVFENERGQHPVLKASVDYMGKCEFSGDKENPDVSDLKQWLGDLLDLYGMWIYLRLWDMSIVLGIPWLAIEGYYDPESKCKPFVCDADLPPDLAFVGK
jgi:pyruvate, orthophosphate dikinase